MAQRSKGHCWHGRWNLPTAKQVEHITHPANAPIAGRKPTSIAALPLLATAGAAAGWAFAILAIAAPLHVYKQLRHACDLSRFSALWRFAALLVLGAF